MWAPVKSLADRFRTSLTNSGIKRVAIIKSGCDKSMNYFLKIVKRKKLLILRQEPQLKKDNFTTAFIWLSNFRCSSKITPRFFIQGLTGVDNQPRFKLETTKESEGPKTVISVLFSLKFRKFSANHALTSARQARRAPKPSEFRFMGR